MPPFSAQGGLERGPFRAGRTEGPEPAMTFGRQVIATGDVVWNRVFRIPPRGGSGAIGL